VSLQILGTRHCEGLAQQLGTQGYSVTRKATMREGCGVTYSAREALSKEF